MQTRVNEYDAQVIQYADRILRAITHYGNFPFESIIDNLNLEKEERNVLYREIYRLLIYDQNLVEIDTSGYGTSYRLTDKGRLAKEKGGFLQYKGYCNEVNKIENERQELNDKKLRYDVKNAKRIFKTYWWTFGISIAAFLLTVGKIIYDFFARK